MSICAAVVRAIKLFPVVIWCSLVCSSSLTIADDRGSPPFGGTIFDFPNLIRESDPTAFEELRFVERSEREMFDRRIDRSQAFPVFVFEATFRNRRSMEVAVNRELGTEATAHAHAELDAKAFGRLPPMLCEEVDAIHIQGGKQLFGGGRNLLIHVEQGADYRKDGTLEETLGHEAAHALDARLATHPAWLAAQKQDGQFISKYAQDNPQREDIAESLIPYFAVRFRPDRITKKQKMLITEAIPARTAFFDLLKPRPFPPQDKN